MQRFVTDFGVIDAPTKHDADRLAYRRWLEDGWRQGGYKPMSREQFESRYPAVK